MNVKAPVYLSLQSETLVFNTENYPDQKEKLLAFKNKYNSNFLNWQRVKVHVARQNEDPGTGN